MRMMKRIIVAIFVLVILAAGYVVYQNMVPHVYQPAKDEIAIHFQLDTKEDIGLLVYDCSIDDHD